MDGPTRRFTLFAAALVLALPASAQAFTPPALDALTDKVEKQAKEGLEGVLPDLTGIAPITGKGKAEVRVNDKDKPVVDDAGTEDPGADPGDDSPSAPAKPERGESVNAKPKRGQVKVRLPGQSKSVPLDEAASLPVGTIVDATEGAAQITAAASPTGGTQQATFSGSAFQITQPRTRGLTEIRLRGGNLNSCPAVFRASYLPLAGVSATRGRSLWGRGKGRFRTRGRHGAATVRGTIWRTADTCSGTLVVVKRGVVDVKDFAKRKTVTVRAGGRYLARRATPSPARARS